VEREERGEEGKKGSEKEERGREWRVKMCCPMSYKLSPPVNQTSPQFQVQAHSVTYCLV